MKSRFQSALWMAALCHLAAGAASVQTAPQAQGGGRPAQNQEEQRRREQPGSTQGAATTAETDAQPKFNMDYFVGEWTFESTVSESPLGAGGPMSGSETVRNMLDGRFWDVYARGTYQNHPQFAAKIYLTMPGRYFYRLANLDTRGLADGVYMLRVAAGDTRGNVGVGRQVIGVCNRNPAPCERLGSEHGR